MTGPAAIDVRLREVAQLFNSFDASPFHEKDLDPAAREFIVARARDEPSDAPLVLVLHLERVPDHGVPGCEQDVRDAVRNDFAYLADLRRRDLRELFRQGRTSLAIGLVFLAACLFGARALGESPTAFLGLVRESLLIAGWVAMWRPIEIFLYEWWPLARRERLLRRIAAIDVRVVGPDASA